WGVLLLLILLAILGFVVMPCFHFHCGHVSNDRTASVGLKILVTAETDFRANDRDGNRLNDYWTGDVKGLYTLTSAVVPGAKANSTLDPSIKLIELSMAAADADGTFLSAGGENVELSNFAVPSVKAGF